MKVIEKYNDSLHNPFWKFQLGPCTYEVKDTPLRVDVDQEAASPATVATGSSGPRNSPSS